MARPVLLTTLITGIAVTTALSAIGMTASAASPTQATFVTVSAQSGSVKPTTPKISLTVLKKSVGSGRIVNGDKITASGTASKSLAGQRVYLERYSQSNKKWISAAASAVVAKTGAFTTTTKSAGSGSVGYRLTSKKTSKLNAARSNTRAITVWKWYDLGDYLTVDSRAMYSFSTTLSIAGKVYTKSVLGSAYSSSGWVEYNLGYRCATLQATTGLSDSSSSGAQLILESAVDGVQKSSASYGVGTAGRLQIDTTQGFRVRLGYFLAPKSTTGTAAWGSPRVLCTAPPGEPRT